MTKGEVLEKYGMRMLRTDLDEEDSDGKFENFIKGMLDFAKEVDENIKNYCVKCKYYQTKDSDKCDSWIHGASYGVDCKYIGKAKGEDMSKYEGRRIIDF